MGWLSDLFGWGGDDAGGNQTMTSETKLPAHITEFTKEQLNLARELGNQPYTPYSGELVSPFSQDQMTAQQSTRDNQGIWRPGIDQAAEVARTMTTEGMNPYLDSVGARIDESFDKSQNARNAQSVASGGYGDRSQIFDAELANQRAMTQGTMQADAFKNMQQQRAMGMQGLRNTAGDQARFAAGDVAALNASGAQQQGLAQLGLDTNYQQFLKQEQDPTRRFNLRQTAIGNLPYGQTGTQSAPVPQSTWAQNVGALAAGAGGLGSFFSTPGDGGQSAWGGLKQAAKDVKWW
tara:strand:+ start:81 stop:956 length:876 start_codon:yes stop_codon:yes gene_type:complete